MSVSAARCGSLCCLLLVSATAASRLGAVGAQVTPQPARGASLVVSVVERGGGARSRVGVHVAKRSGDGSFERVGELVTDGDGLARLDGLEPGLYAIDGGRLEPPFVFAGASREGALVQLGRGEARLVPMEVVRGVELFLNAELINPVAGLRLVVPYALNRRGSANESLGVVGSGTERRLMLEPATWDLAWRPPPGLLPRAYHVDGVPQAGLESALDLFDALARTVDLELEAEAWVTGQVVATRQDGSVVRGGGPPIEARLLAAGPGLERWRGSIESALVSPLARQRDLQFLALPEGRWLLAPSGASIVSSEPEAIELDVARGGAYSVEFDVVLADRDSSLGVSVTAAEGRRPLDDAVVEVYRLESEVDPGAGELVASGTTDRHGVASFPGLEPSTFYRLVAGHPDGLDGEHGPVAGFGFQRIALERGARIDLLAVGPAGEPLAGVEVELEWLGAGGLARAPSEDEGGGGMDGAAPGQVAVSGPRPVTVPEEIDGEGAADDRPPTLLADSRVAERKRLREVETGRRGDLQIEGLDRGLYLLTARVPSNRSAIARVVLRRPGDEPELELGLRVDEPSQIVDVEAFLLPAARFAASLICDDGGQLPSIASARVERLLLKANGVWVTDSSDDAILKLDERALAGPDRDRAVIGPVDVGVYRVGFRPHGFSRWTWAYQASDPESATPFAVSSSQVLAGEELDLGQVVVPCEPAADILFSGNSSEELEAFGDGEVEVRVAQLEEVQPHRAFPLQPTWRLFGDGIRVGRLGPGRSLLDIVLRHPLLLPEGDQQFRLVVDVGRGEHAVLPAERLRLGGALYLVRGAEGMTVEWRRRESSEIGRTVLGETPWLGALVPGTYDVALCRDEACAEVVEEWTLVDVEAGRELRLP